MAKRILAFCMSVLMLFSALPAQAFASEAVTEPTVMETVAETTLPTEVIPETEIPVPETTLPEETESETQATIPAAEETIPETEETVAPTISEESLPEEYIPEETIVETFEEEIVTAPAAASGTYGSLSWNYENETLTVSGSGAMEEGSYPWSRYSANVTTLVVEAGVASIASSAFLGFTALTDVTLPGTVKTIGIAAFANCAQLEQITIPEGVETIDFVAFQECCDLTTVSLPVSLTAIHQMAFRECAINDVFYAGDAQQWAAIRIDEYNESLTEAIVHFGDGTIQESTKPTWSLADGVLTISGTGAMEDYATAPWYAQQAGIHTLVVGEGITAIGNSAFKALTELRNVTLPETLAVIGMYAFSGCRSLATISLPAGLERIGVGAFSDCTALTEISIPANVKTISDAAFSECSGLAQVFLPGGLQTIGDFAFQDCPITHVYYNGSDLDWCSVVIGMGNEALTEAEMNYAQVTGSASGRCGENLTWLLADGILTISGTGKMYDYEGQSPWAATARTIRMLTVEEGVTSIGDFAFAACASLTALNLPSTLETIGTCAFSTCAALTEVSIPEGVTAIGDAAFIDCSKLSQLTLPASLASIGLCAFSDPPLTAVYYGSTAADWAKIAIGEENGGLLNASRFYADGSIAGTWGSNVSWLLKDGTLTISGSGDLKTGSIMPWSAYKNTIQTITIEEGITSLPAASFGLYTKMTRLNLPGSLERIGDGAFATCAALEEVVIPEGLKHIGAAVFIDCAKLTTVHLPSTLETVGDFAFRDCPLTDVYYADTESRWNELNIGIENEALTGAAIHYLSGPADYTIFSGKTLTLSVIDPSTRKPYSSKQINWTLDEEYEPFASIKSGKLTAKTVFEAVRVVAVGTIAATGETVSYKIDIAPALTHLLVLDSEGNNVSGQTLTMDYSDETLTLTADVLPETMADISWSVSDSKKTLAEDYRFDGSTLTIVGPKGKSGTVTIKATAEAGVKKTVTVKVTFGSFAKTVAIAEPEKTTIRSGETLALSAAITEPETVSKPGINWSVSDSKLASISSGKLKAKNVAHPETITVTATSKDGCASDFIQITILPKTDNALVLYAGGYVTNGTKALNTGDTMTVEARNAGDSSPVSGTVKWSSAKESVATVSADGVITAVSSGSAKITAQTEDGRKASFTVKVSTLVTDLSLTTKDGSLIKEGDEFIIVLASGKSVSLVAYALNEGASNAVTWDIADGGEYAKVSSSGKFTANKDLTKAAYVTVKATAKDGSGYSETIRVKIRPIATGVQIFENGSRVRSNTVYTCDMTTNPVLKLNARVYPADAGQTTVFTSSNKKVADFVDGELVCYKTGSVTITATAADGSNQKATFKLNIVKKVQSVSVSETAMKGHTDPSGAYVLAGGKSVKLDSLVTVAPADASNKKLDWSVAPNEIGATVSNGTLKTPKVTQRVTLNVMGIAQDGSGKMVSFNINVYPAITKADIQMLVESPQGGHGFETVTGKTLELKVGETMTLCFDATPSSAHMGATWFSSNKAWAEISEDGIVTGLTAGKTVTITATSQDGTNQKATVKIKVVK